jgi:hypothetical protein
MLKSKYSKVKIIHALWKVNIGNYRIYLLARVRCLESAEQDCSSLVYSSGAWIGPGDGDLDGCTSSDGDSDDDAIFSFQTSLGCGLNFGVVGSSFTTYPSSSFFGSWFLRRWADRRLLLEHIFFACS